MYVKSENITWGVSRCQVVYLIKSPQTSYRIQSTSLPYVALCRPEALNTLIVYTGLVTQLFLLTKSTHVRSSTFWHGYGTSTLLYFILGQNMENIHQKVESDTWTHIHINMSPRVPSNISTRQYYPKKLFDTKMGRSNDLESLQALLRRFKWNHSYSVRTILLLDP